MRLICHPTMEDAPPIRRAPATRPWMDKLPHQFAYRCLPLTMASSYGWELLCPSAFDATWLGGEGEDDIRVEPVTAGAGAWVPVGHFGSGILTFHTGYFFRTEENVNLWASGPVNYNKHAVVPLSGLIETDWAPYTFTMNWAFTEKNHTVRFEKDEPFCSFFPVPRGLLESVEPEIREFDSIPETKAQYEAWSASRRQFNADLPTPGTEANENRWQKNYYRGRFPDGTEGSETHQTKLRLRDFFDFRDEPDGGS